MSEKESYANNIAVTLPFKTTDETELPPPVYKNPQIINDGWKNIGFAIAFWIHTLIVIFIALILGIPALFYYSRFSSDDSLKQVALLFNIKIILYALSAAAMTGLLVSFVAFFILQVCTGCIIKCSFTFTIIIQVFVAVIAIIVILWPAFITIGVTLLIPIVIALIIITMYFFCVRKRVQFAEAHLRVGSAILRSHSSLISVVLCMLVVQVLWFGCWYLMVIGIHHAISDLILNPNETETTILLINTRTRLTNNGTDRFDTTFKETEHNIELFRRLVIKIGRGHSSLVIEFALLYSFYWGAATFRNIVHFITACTVGHWWFSGDTSRQYTIGISFKRAFTTNFGTIAFGSLLVSIVRTLRLCEQRNQRKKDIVRSLVACYAACILRQIERFLGCLGRWAFNYAALTGQSFMDASRSFIELVDERGWSMIIDDGLVGTALSIVTFTVGLASATAGSLVFYTFTSNSSSRNNFTIHIAFICFVLGVSMSTVMTSILSSCVRTVIVCFALNPTILGTTHPEHLQNLVETWHTFHPEAIPNVYINNLPKPTPAENGQLIV
jgi:hypothetical protein